MKYQQLINVFYINYGFYLHFMTIAFIFVHSVPIVFYPNSQIDIIMLLAGGRGLHGCSSMRGTTEEPVR